MSEAGVWYNQPESDLYKWYHQSRDLIKSLRDLDSRDKTTYQQLLSQLLGFVGNNVLIQFPFHCEFGKHISIGENTFVNANCVFIDNAEIEVGANVLIAPAVQIYTATHPVDPRERFVEVAGESYIKTISQKVSIGDNAWIGGGAVVLPGVSIGDNAVIGAGSVVTKNIGANMLAYGSPCKEIKSVYE